MLHQTLFPIFNHFLNVLIFNRESSTPRSTSRWPTPSSPSARLSSRPRRSSASPKLPTRKTSWPWLQNPWRKVTPSCLCIAIVFYGRYSCSFGSVITCQYNIDLSRLRSNFNLLVMVEIVLVCPIWVPLFSIFLKCNSIAYIHPVYGVGGLNPRSLDHEPSALTTRPRLLA